MLAVPALRAQTDGVSAPLQLWILRALWLALPFTLLDALLVATDGAQGSTRVAVQCLFWALWASALVVSLTPLPSTLTALRMLLPMAPAAALCALVVGPAGTLGWLGMLAGALAAILAMAAATGDWFVDGASYGDERRFCLRAPVALLLGPIELAWLLAVVPLPAGVLLFTEQIYLAAVPLILLGIATAWWGPFALWRLARRWVVFVPAGITLVDDMAIAEPVLFPRRAVTRIGPAHVATEATDLTVGAPGLVLEVDLSGPIDLAPAPRRGEPTEAVAVDSVLIVPSRPGTLLAHAETRGLVVVRD